jgi:hypothetical protein
MKYTGTYETSVQVNQFTRFNIPGDNYVFSHNHESFPAEENIKMNGDTV